MGGRICLFGRWRRGENILRIEGRALVLAVRRRLRECAACGSRFLILCVNMSVTLAVEKGRSSSHLVNQTVRETTALSILFNVAISVRWIASEHNAADKLPPPSDAPLGTHDQTPAMLART
eukprot:7474675-Pyramimonas_sp.AAC.1